MPIHLYLLWFPLSFLFLGDLLSAPFSHLLPLLTLFLFPEPAFTLSPFGISCSHPLPYSEITVSCEVITSSSDAKLGSTVRLQVFAAFLTVRNHIILSHCLHSWIFSHLFLFCNCTFSSTYRCYHATGIPKVMPQTLCQFLLSLPLPLPPTSSQIQVYISR